MIIIIPGEPMGKGRPRATKTGHMYTPEKTMGYENLVKMCYMEQCEGEKIEGELNVFIHAYFTIPKVSKALQWKMEQNIIRPTKKPDADNIAKIVLDSLNGLAYDDDKNVVKLAVTKSYAVNPRVWVSIEKNVND